MDNAVYTQANSLYTLFSVPWTIQSVVSWFRCPMDKSHGQVITFLEEPWTSPMDKSHGGVRCPMDKSNGQFGATGFDSELSFSKLSLKFRRRFFLSTLGTRPSKLRDCIGRSPSTCVQSAPSVPSVRVRPPILGLCLFRAALASRLVNLTGPCRLKKAEDEGVLKY